MVSRTKIGSPSYIFIVCIWKIDPFVKTSECSLWWPLSTINTYYYCYSKIEAMAIFLKFKFTACIVTMQTFSPGVTMTKTSSDDF